jgi:hypothetical protein
MLYSAMQKRYPSQITAIQIRLEMVSVDLRPLNRPDRDSSILLSTGRSEFTKKNRAGELRNEIC